MCTLLFSLSFAYQYHRPSGTVKYRHDGVVVDASSFFFFVPFHHGDCPSEKYINRKKRRWAREKERKGLFTTLRLHRRKCAPSTGGSHFENEQERKVAVNPSDLSVHHWRICHQTISSHPVEECQGLTLSLKKTSSLSSSTVVIKNDTRQGK